MAAAEDLRSDPHIIIKEQKKDILRLWLNNPQRRNALSEELLSRLNEEIEAAGASEEIKCIIIGARGAVFSSGHDLKQFKSHRQDRDGGRAYFTAVLAQCSQLMQSIVLVPKPVIAEVQGLASAGGLQLVASCDLAIAARSAKFCTPGVDIGLFCSTPMVALTRVVQARHAAEMLLTGDVYSAEDAFRFGLVNRVVPDEQLAQATDDLARRLAAKSSQAIAMGKRALAAQQRLSLDHAYAHCSKVMVENLLNADAEEGIGAFLEKRRPRWPD